MVDKRLKLRRMLGGPLLAVLPLLSLCARPAVAGIHDGGPDVSPLTQPSEKMPEAPPGALTPPDRATLQKLHDANQMEIQMGTLAKDKGSTKAVRELGRRLIADHTAADHRFEDYLRRHADAKTFATTTSADPDHEMLATKSGTEFDRAFGLQMIADHTKAIGLVESALIETADGQLRDIYQTLLPVLQAHKKSAQDIVTASARS